MPYPSSPNSSRLTKRGQVGTGDTSGVKAASWKRGDVRGATIIRKTLTYDFSEFCGLPRMHRFKDVTYLRMTAMGRSLPFMATMHGG